MQQIPFIDLFKSIIHVSGDKLTQPQEHILTVYTAFGKYTYIAAGRCHRCLYQENNMRAFYSPTNGALNVA